MVCLCGVCVCFWCLNLQKVTSILTLDHRLAPGPGRKIY